MRAWVPLFLVIAACGDNSDGNRAPIVGEITLSTLEDVPVTRTIVAVDNDVGDVLEARVMTPPFHGTVTFADLSLTYSPAANYHGNDRFTFVVTDGVDETPVDVFVAITTVQDPPIGGPDSLATNEDTPRQVPVAALLANDTDADGDPIFLVAVSGAVNGTVNLSNGIVTFAPDANFKGGASFMYTITDGQLSSDVPVEVVVGGVNDAPVANDDKGFETPKNTPLTIPAATLLANDTDADGQTLTIQSVASGTGGTVELDGADVIFTPTTGFSGTATFTYVAFDGIATDSATVTVTVISTNDAPVAQNDVAATDEDTAVTIDVLGNDTDSDGPSALTVQSVTNETNGTATINVDNTITFTPAADFAGPTATFDYVVTDGEDTATATVTITIDPVNDPVTAVDDTGFTTDEKTPITLTTLTDNDVDVDIATQGQTLTITNVANAVNGSVVLDAGHPVFTPSTNATANQTGSFEYTVSDSNGSTSTATVTITITPVNDAPTAVDDSGSTNEDAPITFTTLTANDTDPENQVLTVQSVGNAVNGSVVLEADGSVTFTPAPNFPGPTASFDYVVSDGAGGTDTATVTITVNPVNDPVEAVDDTGFTTDEKTPITLTTLTANDVDVDIATQGQTLTITDVANPVNGTVTLVAGQPVFTPTTNSATNQIGTFEYTVSDNNGSTDVGLVTITITPINDPPIAADDSIAQVDAATSFAHSVFLANDNDGGDGAALTITAVSDATNGSVVLDASTITFTPTAPGPASFKYTISDGGAVTSTATVTITVVDCGDGEVQAPETCDDGNNDPDDGCSAVCKVEDGFTCDNTSGPSVCTTVCGDGVAGGTEECDDGNDDDTDGCTTQCIAAAPCTTADIPGATTTAVDPATGHCYARFIDPVFKNFADAETTCEALGGHLATITSADENAILAQVTAGPLAPSWIGAFDDGVDGDQVGQWVTGEPFGFNDIPLGDPGLPGIECFANVNLPDPSWTELSCTTPLEQYTCEIEPESCGDGIVQTAIGEQCDDGNSTSGDGCSSTCQFENGCGNGNLDPGEECDDDNRVDGDGCSSQCTNEIVLTSFTFTGAAGNEATFDADTATGIVLPAMSRGAGVTGSAATNAFSASNWTTGDVVDPTDFFSFTITPLAGNTVTITEIHLDERRSSTGIRQWVLRSSVDGFVADLASVTVPDNDLTRSHVLTLPPTLVNLTSVEFRVFGFEAEAGSGTWRLDNVSVLGSTAPAP